jgi:hypothetical protein
MNNYNDLNNFNEIFYNSTIESPKGEDDINKKNINTSMR